MKKISKTAATNLIKESRGRFFTVKFKVEDEGERCYNCRYKDQSTLGLILINTKDGIKSFYPKSIISLKINKEEYGIRK